MSRPTARPSAGVLSAPLPISRRQLVVHAVTILVALSCMGANSGSQVRLVTGPNGSCRSQHFVVQAPTSEFARQVCAEAERFRRELAIEWLGQELPPWQDPCPIRVTVGRNLGAGGATSFTFIHGQPRGWEMDIQGSRQRILDSVLPHEVTHTIMATHFGRPLPRWADEGAATSVEHTSERTKQDRLLIEFLTTNRGIAFNHMFAMKEYPRDILPLYSQGYSLARFLIARGGKRKFVDYVGDGMRWNNWTAATQKHYNMRSLSELQVTWLSWVRQGSPNTIPHSVPNTAIAMATPTRPATPPRPLASTSPNAHPSELVPLPSPVAPRAPGAASNATNPPSNTTLLSPSDGWYSRHRDNATQQSEGAKQRVGRPSGRVLR